MPGRKHIFGRSGDQDQVWMVDQYRMERIRLKHFFLRDQFSEPGYSYGQSWLYFWQHRGKDAYTMKVRATVTDSNARAHALLDSIKSSIANPDAITQLDPSFAASKWFEATEAESVHFVHAGSHQLMAMLVWGNVFFHIESIGEEDCSIESLLEDLGNVWVTRKQAIPKKPNFSLVADRTECHLGDEIRLTRRDAQKHDDYYAYLYVAGPKEHVDLYRKNGVFRLKVNTPPKDAGNTITPYVRLTGLLPNGHFVESERLAFTIK